ncbi:MAG: class I SAM-dependent methyltransferase [Planctomycetes bacterium]|nr:class I SAM-dependent methyltransferase [Planctomycetota bacterium]
MQKTNKIKTYAEAVQRGDYNLYSGNLFGKHDNVRTYWEDQLTRIVLRPYLSKLVADRQNQGRNLRILDLGSGTGQGYELITKIDKLDLDLSLQHDRILPEDKIDVYLGLDLCQEMVDKGNAIFKDNANINFQQADLREGLATVKDEKSFDIYFSSYASMSHLDKQHLIRLLKDICIHSSNDSLIIFDFLGRYSIEWPDYWNVGTEAEKIRDYSMSYLHSKSEEDVEVEHFPVRFWTGDEVENLAEEIFPETKIRIELLRKFDRSILVGRHMDTKQYNPILKPMRKTVNCLHENYMRTDLSNLIIDTSIIPNHTVTTSFLNELVKSWNVLVNYCQQRFENHMSLMDLEDWSEFPNHLQFVLMNIDRVINDTGWMWYGEPRANIIEPQLGYALRNLEIKLQKGLGCGHGLVAIFKVTK